MKLRTVQIVFLSFMLVMVLLSMPSVLADGFKFAQKSISTTNNPTTLSIQRESALTPSADLYIKNYFDTAWNSYSMNRTGDVFTVTIPGSILDSEGVYQYYILGSDNSRYPDGSGYATFTVSSTDVVINKFAQTFLENDQTGNDWFCQPHSGSADGMVCFWANMQSDESLRFALGNKRFANATYENYSLDLAFSVYNNYSGFETETKLCDQSKNDFNCSSYSPGAGMYFSGARRQGDVIADYVQVANLLNNQSVLDLAIKYGNGSAEECDVWHSDYDCSCVVTNPNCIDEDNQGSMLYAYWSLYDATGVLEYKTIAKSLSQDPLSDSNSALLLLGFAKAYELTGNQTYYHRMLTLANNLIDECLTSSCTPVKKADNILAYAAVYEQTGSPVFLEALSRKLLRQTSTDCDPLYNDYNCTSSQQQGRLNTAYLQALSAFPQTKAISGLFYHNYLFPGNDVFLDVNVQGYLNNLTLFYSSSAYGKKNISFNYYDSSVSIPATDVSIPGKLSLYIDANGTRFPLNNGSIVITVKNQDSEIMNKLSGFLNADPHISCDPHGTNGDTPNFSCQREHFQSLLLQGFVDGACTQNASQSSYQNQLFSYARNLGTSFIDLDSGLNVESTCEYLNNDYSCELQAPDFSDVYQRKGVIRQSVMMSGFFDLYQQTKNSTYLDRALSYTYNSPSECDVWSNDYSCGTLGSAYYALAFWDAYTTTGYTDMLTHAMVLTTSLIPLDSTRYSEVGALALWRGYELTGNQSFLIKARNMTAYYKTKCISSYTCSMETLSLNTLVLLDALRLDVNGGIYFNKAFLNGNYVSPKGATRYCDTVRPEYSCHTPYEQGLAAKMYSSLSQNLLESGDTTFSINLSLPSRANYTDIFNVTCVVKNTNATASYELFLVTPLNIVNATASTGVFDSTFHQVTFSSLLVNDSRYATWTLNASWGGPTTVRCVVASTENFSSIIIENLFDILSSDLNVSSLFILENSSTALSLNLSNIVDFTHYNLTANFSVEYTNGSILNSSIVNISDIDLNYTLGVIANNSVLLSEMYANDSAILTADYAGFSLGDYHAAIDINTQYGGNTSVYIPIYVYEEEPLDYTQSLASVLSINKLTNITFTFNLTGNYTYTNLSLFIDSANFTVYNVSTTNNSLWNLSNPQNITANSLQAYTNETITWLVAPKKVSTSQTKINISAEQPPISFTTIPLSTEVLGNVFVFNETMLPSNPLFNDGDIYVINISLSQTSDSNLTSVIASGVAGRGVVILASNTTDSSLTSGNQDMLIATNSSGGDILQVINTLGNNVTTSPNDSVSFAITALLENKSYTSMFFSVNTTETINISVYNGSDYLSLCSLVNTTCALPLTYWNNSFVNISVFVNSGGQLDFISLNYTYKTIFESGLLINTLTHNFSTIRPEDMVQSNWQVQVTGTEDTFFRLDVRSDQSASASYTQSFTAFTKPEEHTGTGGMGGAYFPLKIKYYSYSNFDFCSAFSNYSKIQSIINYKENCESKTNQSISMATNDAKDCFFVERSYTNKTVQTDFLYNCSNNFKEILVFDDIGKEIFLSTDNFTINSTGTTTILRRDPLLMYIFTNSSGSFSYFSLESNELTKFVSPLFVIIPLTNLSFNETTNTTTSIPTLDNDSPSGEGFVERNTHSNTTDVNIKDDSITFSNVSLSTKKAILSISKSIEKNYVTLLIILGIIFLIAILIVLRKKGFLRHFYLHRHSHKNFQVFKRIRDFFRLLKARLRVFIILHFFHSFSTNIGATYDEFSFVTQKTVEELIADIYFIFQELNFKQNPIYSSIMIEKLRLVRFSLLHSISIFHGEVSQKEVDTFCMVLTRELAAAHNYFRHQHLSLKEHQKSYSLLSQINSLNDELRKINHSRTASVLVVSSVHAHSAIDVSSRRKSAKQFSFNSLFSFFISEKKKIQQEIKQLISDVYMDLKLVNLLLLENKFSDAQILFQNQKFKKRIIEKLLSEHSQYTRLNNLYQKQVLQIYEQLAKSISRFSGKK